MSSKGIHLSFCRPRPPSVGRDSSRLILPSPFVSSFIKAAAPLVIPSAEIYERVALQTGKCVFSLGTNGGITRLL